MKAWKPENLDNKRILVAGLGITGVECVRFLLNHGAKVFGYDDAEKTILSRRLPADVAQGLEDISNRVDEKMIESLDMIVLSPGIPLTKPFIRRAKAEGMEVIGEIELACRFIKKPIVAVTGTNGKSTTVEITSHILQKSGFSAPAVGNVGIPLISFVDKQESVDVFVVEISSYQLESTVDFKPEIAALLNISEDHLERHGDFKNYMESKFRIFRNQTKEDWAIIFRDDESLWRSTEKIRAKKLGFGTGKRKEEGAWLVDHKIEVLLPDGREGTADLRNFPVPGRHNALNAAAALLAGAVCGAQLDSMARAFSSFTPGEHRLELVAVRNRVRFYNDSKATNADAVAKALQTVEGPIILLMGGLAKKSGYSILKPMMAEKVKLLITFGDASQYFYRLFKDSVRAVEAGSIDEAFSIAVKESREGDAVLLSPGGSSFDAFDNYKERGSYFKKLVKTQR